MFAGPNGSGKSTIKSVVPESLLGIYINPDEIQKEAAHSGYLVVQDYSVETSPEEILEFLRGLYCCNVRALLKRLVACDLTTAAWTSEMWK